MIPFKIGDRVKVNKNAGFSRGSTGTIIEITNDPRNYSCFINRDNAGPKDRMGFYFSELEHLQEDAPFGESIAQEEQKAEVISMARELYIEWCARCEGLSGVSKEEIDNLFGSLSDYSFQIAEIWILKSKEYKGT